MTAVAATGSPIAPSSINFLQVWCASPRKVSGALPMRRFLSAASSGQLRSLAAIERKGLFAKDMLARVQDRPVDLRVRRGDGQVDHQFHLGVLEQLLDRPAAWHANPLACALARSGSRSAHRTISKILNCLQPPR